MDKDDSVAIEQRLELLDLLLVYGALWQEHDVHTPGLPASGHEHAVQQIEVEALGGLEFVEAIRFPIEPPHGALERAEVRLPYLKRPWQQQHLRVFGLGIRAAMAGGHLMPARLHARALHARIA